MSLVQVAVRLAERSYGIDVGSGLLVAAASHLANVHWTHAVVIADANVVAPHAQLLVKSLESHGRVDLLTVPAGEGSKSVAQAQRLWDGLLDLGTDRKSLVVAVGGGVIGDLAGFIAATFARGIRFIQIPTTLLAQVDSSVGGKVGVNLPSAKNMIGAFWQPQHVLADIQTLATLPSREFRSGLAEVVKYGVIVDADFFAYLENHVDAVLTLDPDVLTHVVATCCRLKAEVVAQDERETKGLRAVLNYGHTFAHALESVSGYGVLLHGEAVSIGMICASRLAESLGRVDAELTRRQERLLRQFELPVAVPDLDTEQLVAAMRTDKKVEHGQLHFVLPSGMGHVERVAGVHPDLVRAALEEV